jgi:hypothetical protein
MKQSDSATSLTNLVVCDTACYFCNEPSDPEKGMPLIDTRNFLNCECRLTTHTKCWVHHLAENVSDRVACPLCNTPIAGWKKKEMTESVKESEPSSDKKRSYKILGYWFLGFIIVVGLTLIILKCVNII